MSFGGFVHYGMKYAHRINTRTPGTKTNLATEASGVTLLHPCVACCHVDRCKNTNCGAHPLSQQEGT